MSKKHDKNRYWRYAKAYLENPGLSQPALSKLADVSEKFTADYCHEATADIIEVHLAWLIKQGWKPPKK